MLEPCGRAAVRSIAAADLLLATGGITSQIVPAIAPVQTVRFPLDQVRPAVLRVPLLDTRPRVSSHRFPRPTDPVPMPDSPRVVVQPTAVADCQPDPAGDQQGDHDVARQRRRTRIAPPGDVVKLSERLFFVLQPDLETTLQASHLEFPREPFPFQLDGMAFLMPRHGAILADEMGLGKSMQAISSLRLLVRSGQARRVLVVCPKGLVSNWARELADWAPELLVAVIEGDPARRR